MKISAYAPAGGVVRPLRPFSPQGYGPVNHDDDGDDDDDDDE